MRDEEYSTEYQKLIMKQQLKNGIELRTVLIETMKKTDKVEVLKQFIMTEDIGGQIASNNKMLTIMWDEPEIQELINSYSRVIVESKRVAEDRLEALEKAGNKTNEEKENKEELDSYTKEEFNNQQSEATLEKRQVDGYNFEYRNQFIGENYDGQEITTNIKNNVRSCLNSMRIIKSNLDSHSSSPTMLSYLAGSTNVLEDNIKLAISIQQMPGCDAELMALSEQLLSQTELVKDTLDTCIENYRQINEKSNMKSQEKTMGTISVTKVDNSETEPLRTNGFAAELAKNVYTNDEVANNDIANRTFDSPHIEQPNKQVLVNQNPEI